MGKSIALFISYGPESRAFLYSGFSEKLADKGYKLFVFTPYPNSRVFDRLQFNIISSNESFQYSSALKWFQSQVDQVHLLWMYRQGRKKWRHTLAEPIKRKYFGDLIRSIFASQTGINFLRKFENVLVYLVGTSNYWKQKFQTNYIDVIIVSSIAGMKVLPALYAAKNLGIKIIVITNSWKDVYSHLRVPVIPDLLIVWSNLIKEDVCRANPYMDPGRVRVAKSLHLQNFFTRQDILKVQDFKRITGLDNDRPFILYTAASPLAVPNEESIVEDLLISINKKEIKYCPQILLRLNPMEDGSRFEQLQKKYPKDLIIQKPKWEYDRNSDWCSPLREDSDLFISSLYHCAFNISIPSTVTLEALSMGKKVLNVCFDPVGDVDPSKSIRRFWNADFYREIREKDGVYPAFSLDDLISFANRFLDDRQIVHFATLEQTSTPVDEVVSILEDYLGK